MDIDSETKAVKVREKIKWYQKLMPYFFDYNK
jgi:hypothetical protein